MLYNAIRSLCARAGWKEPNADEKGVYAFNLEGDYSFTLSSPDGERLLARAALLVPGAGQKIAGDTLEEVMRITVARFAKLQSVVALDPESGALEIHAFTSLRDAGMDAHETFLANFLNELSFWQAQPALSAPTALNADT